MVSVQTIPSPLYPGLIWGEVYRRGEVPSPRWEHGFRCISTHITTRRQTPQHRAGKPRPYGTRSAGLFKNTSAKPWRYFNSWNLWTLPINRLYSGHTHSTQIQIIGEGISSNGQAYLSGGLGIRLWFCGRNILSSPQDTSLTANW